jgi:hypothetical protein
MRGAAVPRNNPYRHFRNKTLAPRKKYFCGPDKNSLASQLISITEAFTQGVIAALVEFSQ